MRRTRRNKLKTPSKKAVDEKEDLKDNIQIKKVTKPKTKKNVDPDSSSSESDLDSYLKPASEIDLSSPFFQISKKTEQVSFDILEKDILSDVKKLSDSSSEDEYVKENNDVSESAESIASKLNFQQLQDYTTKMEEAKKHVQNYILQKEKAENLQETSENQKANESQDILSMLTKTESQVASTSTVTNEPLSDSEKEDWEVVSDNQISNKTLTKDIEITVALPDHMKKKKGVDLLAAIKRRLNRIKKENQVFIHKVHLLCWIAHGNFVNNVLNDPQLLASALSLMPSEKAFPKDRIDLKYLQQFIEWYSKTITLRNRPDCHEKSLLTNLQEKMIKKEAYNGKILVYIFICILRALGIQCRLVLSFRVEPLRPPSSQLHSTSTKNNNDIDKTTKKLRVENKVKNTIGKNDKDGSKGNKTNSKKVLKTTKVESESKIDKKATESKKNPVKYHQTVDLSSTLDSFSKSEKLKLSKSKTDKEIKGKLVNLDKLKTKLKNTSPATKTSPKTLIIPKLEEKNNTESTSKRSKRVQKEDKVSEETESKKSKATVDKLSRQCRRSKRNQAVLPQLDGANDSDSSSTSKPNLKKLSKKSPNTCPKNHPKRLKRPTTSYKEPESDSEEDFKPSPSHTLNKDVIKASPSDSVKKISRNSRAEENAFKTKLEKKKIKGDVKDDIKELVKGAISNYKNSERRRMVKVNKKTEDESEESDHVPEKEVKKKKDDSDDDFKIKSNVKVKQRLTPNNKRKVLSSDSEPETTKKGNDVWVEVFVESEEKWISVDVVKAEMHCVKALYTRATKPVSYIIAWNNNNSIKDITSRYCSDWHTVTRKLRVDADWWKQTLKPFTGKTTARDKEEDEELAQMQLEKPLPKTISEYKNHPLYALERHLLKFEAIYPPDAVPLGYIRGEPVYSRYCVYTLHSREIWLKQAKVVKLGEQPYKIVKARPKYDKLSGKVITDKPLEIFGMWQVEDYDPPTAEDGIVPRNAYGNVDLFKECMLPKGCVRLKLPGLNKVAYKLNIDCAEAVVGFDFHGGWSHPIFDGYVVCEEYEDTLVAAWHMEQEEQERKEREKMEKRVYGNWKRLIKGLLITERLKAKYNFGVKSNVDNTGTSNEKRKAKSLKSARDKKQKVTADASGSN